MHRINNSKGDKKMILVITGASGFVGKHVLPLLMQHSIEIHAISRQKMEVPFNGIHWHQVNLFHADDVGRFMNSVKPTHLLHLAWEATPGVYWNSLTNFQWVEASLCLMRHFYDHGGQRMVTAGTCAEYEWGENTLIEDLSPLTYSSPYAVCKNYARALIEDFSKQTGLSCAWGRIFFAYGPYEKSNRLIPYAIRSLLLNQEIRCTDGKHRRDFLFAQDVAEAFISILMSKVEGPVNIASGTAVSIKEVLQQISQRIGKPELIQYGALPITHAEMPLVEGRIHKLQELGWTPKVNLQQGLEDTIKWWKNNITDPS
jgi:nucleoside-diphosphate-sugar epimerase